MQMKILNIISFMLLTTSVATYANTPSLSKVDTKIVNQQISSSRSKIKKWQKTLTQKEMSSLHPLLETYDDVYKEYQTNTHDTDKRSLVLDTTNAIELIMDNWKSFYQPKIA